MSDLSERDHAELLMLYQATIDDIERTKQWGWTVAYATVAAQGGILGLFGAYESEVAAGFVTGLFLLLILGFCVTGIRFVRYSQESLDGFRTRVRNARRNFGDRFNDAFGEPSPKMRWPLEAMIWASTVVVSALLLFASIG